MSSDGHKAKTGLKLDAPWIFESLASKWACGACSPGLQEILPVVSDPCWRRSGITMPGWIYVGMKCLVVFKRQGTAAA